MEVALSACYDRRSYMIESASANSRMILVLTQIQIAYRPESAYETSLADSYTGNPALERAERKWPDFQIASPRTRSHRIIGTITLSLPPVKTASVRLAPLAAIAALQKNHGQESPLLPAHPPYNSHSLARVRPTMTAMAKAVLPSRLFPPLQHHRRVPYRLPINDAAASPMPTHMMPLTMLRLREGISQPCHGNSPPLGIEASDSQRGIEHPMSRNMCETITGPR